MGGATRGGKIHSKQYKHDKRRAEQRCALEGLALRARGRARGGDGERARQHPAATEERHHAPDRAAGEVPDPGPPSGRGPGPTAWGLLGLLVTRGEVRPLLRQRADGTRSREAASSTCIEARRGTP